ncbi:BrxA/BrxB family bacilliredoxin [Thermaerobacter sp. PB12/4term]|uniref:BrxA/BrxB family bacilliredoxin n=1 Tax=Thermaerobacter sp. PB12/4term TaxID=2293838 RepID=UPI000E32B66E|nr:BrxA/BrxB family bacilliredoxin [Thermaerobacter sp. PB12/4term]QIA26398.1 BrxA/BrxB family bacilliredoxin [Thermaerobacter sp. PB12/4term]
MSMEMLDMFFAPMREELVRLGFTELRTPEEVDAAMAEAVEEETTLVVVNSMCGCAGGIARPAVAMALEHERRPQRWLTVFASQDREATARIREYFTGQPPSSPSIALLKGRQLVYMLHRSDIENRTAEEVAADLKAAFDRFCA